MVYYPAMSVILVYCELIMDETEMAIAESRLPAYFHFMLSRDLKNEDSSDPSYWTPFRDNYCLLSALFKENSGPRNGKNLQKSEIMILSRSFRVRSVSAGV